MSMSSHQSLYYLKSYTTFTTSVLSFQFISRKKLENCYRSKTNRICYEKYSLKPCFKLNALKKNSIKKRVNKNQIWCNCGLKGGTFYNAEVRVKKRKKNSSTNRLNQLNHFKMTDRFYFFVTKAQICDNISFQTTLY